MISKVFFQHTPFYGSMIVPRTRELGLPGSPLSKGSLLSLCLGRTVISTCVGNILCDSAGLSSCPRGLCACPGSTCVSGMPRNKNKCQA